MYIYIWNLLWYGAPWKGLFYHIFTKPSCYYKNLFYGCAICVPKSLKNFLSCLDDDKANNRKTSEKVDVSTDPTSCNDSESVAADEEQDVNAAQKLERMTERRKAIERENKRKKEVLAQTIAAR